MSRTLFNAALSAALFLPICSYGEPEKTAQDIQRLELEQERLLKQVKREFEALPELPPKAVGEPKSVSEQRQRRAKLAALIEEIERRIEQDAAGRTKYVLPHDKDAALRSYYERFRQRVESEGTRQWPMRDGKRLYGEATVLIEIRADGSLERVEVTKTTSKAIAAHVRVLFRQLEPFERFPAEVVETTDRIVVSTPLKYERK